MKCHFKSILLCLICFIGTWVTLASCASTAVPIPETQEEYDAVYPTVTFGTFPQSAKAENVKIDESSVTKVNGFDCYKGNDDKLYAKYNGKYFLMEDIEWYVLSDDYEGGQLLLAKKALVAHNFYDSKDDRKINGKTVHANNYKYSDLRAYLNGLDGTAYNVSDYTGKGFIDLAFSDDEKAKILTVKVDNSAKSTNDAGGNIGKSKYPCENTKDRIFVLSSQEVTANKYGFDSYNQKFTRKDGVKFSSRLRWPTDFAVETGSYEDDFYGNSTFWWLRSPGLDATPNAGVNDDFSKLEPTPYYIHHVDPAGYAYLMGLVTEETSSIVPSLVLKKDK